MKIITIVALMILLGFPLALAHEHNLDEVKQLIESELSCDELTEEQLESIGEYYMEQMHPGEAHELMDRMMGGEGSESLKQAHINIAERLYCNKNSGMMGQGIMGSGKMMMGGGMMQTGGESIAYGMMGGTGMYGAGLFGLVYLAIAAFVVSAIFWWTYNWLVKGKKPL